MSNPDDIPKWALDEAYGTVEERNFEMLPADQLEMVQHVARTIMAAVKREREACALAAYTSPHYTVGAGFGDLDENGLLRPGSPYDAGRYDAAIAILKRGEVADV
jgi:hypothetical protein